MRYLKVKKTALILVGLALISTVGLAQPEDMKPGITPDSPLYFMDRAFDRFQSTEKVADERAAEMMAMAEKNKSKAMEKAEQGYTRAMERKMNQVEENPEEAENAMRQSAKHMESFSNYGSGRTDDFGGSLKRAMNRSTRSMGESFQTLNRTDPQKATQVAEQTLQRVMENAPEQAQKGLQTAMNAVRGQMPAAGHEADRAPNGREREGNNSDTPMNRSGTPDEPVSSGGT